MALSFDIVYTGARPRCVFAVDYDKATLDSYKEYHPKHTQEEVDLIRWFQDHLEEILLRFSMEYDDEDIRVQRGTVRTPEEARDDKENGECEGS